MLDYDKEADAYDETRGGEPRAEAAAEAVLGLVPPNARRLLDVACGTGIVTRRLAAARPGLRVTGLDAAPAMTRTAAARLPGAIILADSRQLPFPDGVFDAATTVWLLHLAEGPADVRAIIAECARVLRPGGVYVTTVDKAAAHDVGSDIDDLLAPRPRRPAQDRPDHVRTYAAEYGLHLAATPPASGVRPGPQPPQHRRGSTPGLVHDAPARRTAHRTVRRPAGVVAGPGTAARGPGVHGPGLQEAGGRVKSTVQLSPSSPRRPPRTPAPTARRSRRPRPHEPHPHVLAVVRVVAVELAPAEWCRRGGGRAPPRRTPLAQATAQL